MLPSPLREEVGFISYDDSRYFVCAECVENLIIDGFDHVQRLSRGNRVNQDVTVNPNGIVLLEDGVFILQACHLPFLGGVKADEE